MKILRKILIYIKYKKQFEKQYIILTINNCLELNWVNILRTKFFNIYQYIAFLVIFPLTVIVWYNSLSSIKYTLLAISLPVVTAYIVPAIGTNVTGLWEFNSKKLMIGKFRIYHGFVLGSVTSLFGFLLYKIPSEYLNIKYAIIFGLFIAIINYLYDAYAIKSGFIIVHNKPAYEGKNAFLIAADYAPIYFFFFGFIYGIYVEIIKYYFNNPIKFSYLIILLMHISALILPTAIYAIASKIRNKTWGIYKYSPKGEII